MEANNFLCELMLSYTKNRRLAEINTDIIAFVFEKIEFANRKIYHHPFVHLQGLPTILPTGSSSEGIGNIRGGDIDFMAVAPIDGVQFNNTTTRKDRIFADTKQCRNKGFCYLAVNEESCDFFKIESNEVDVVGGNTYLKREALRLKIKQSSENLRVEAGEQGPSFELYPNVDYVPAIKCLDWPSQCEEFFQRQRCWPSQEQLQEIRKDGMHVVLKAFSEDPFEFRTSFSLAERSLIRSFTNIQFATYHFLKTIKQVFKEDEDDDEDDDDDEEEGIRPSAVEIPLKSYFIKIALLHYVERTPVESWTKENFLHNSKCCLEMLASCYNTKCLPHFFIKDCNLFSNYSTEECTMAAKCLRVVTSNWYAQISSMFLLDLDGSMMKEAFYLTRLQKSKLIKRYKRSLGQPMHPDYLSLCLEAFFLHFQGRQFAISEGLVTGFVELTENIHKLIPEEFVHCYGVILRRTQSLLAWMYKSNRSTSNRLLKTLHENAVTITYPVSGFADTVSSRVWIAYYSYLFGMKEEAMKALTSIEDLDSLSPVGYMNMLVTGLELLYLQTEDVFLYEFLYDHFDGNDYCEINCVLLAHYLRAKLLTTTRLEDEEKEEGYRIKLASIEKVAEVIKLVWRSELENTIWKGLVEETVRLLQICL